LPIDTTIRVLTDDKVTKLYYFFSEDLIYAALLLSLREQERNLTVLIKKDPQL